MRHGELLEQVSEGMLAHSFVLGVGRIWCVLGDRICLELDREGNDHIWFSYDKGKNAFVSGGGLDYLILH